MIIDIKVPGVGESISEVEVGVWLKQEGEAVETDEPIVEIESEKAAVEVSAPSSGVLVEILKPTGSPAVIDEVIGRIDTEKQAAAPEPSAKTAEEPSAAEPLDDATASPGTPAPTEDLIETVHKAQTAQAPTTSGTKVMPAAQRVMAEKGLSPLDVTPSGPGGRILKEDVLFAPKNTAQVTPAKPKPQPVLPPDSPPPFVMGDRSETRERMSRLRRTIAERLLHAKQNMAILTTFNELDMYEVKKLRKSLGPQFLEKHGIKLGFMSFFVKAVVAALQDFPVLNARIEGEEIVTSHFCDIGVAVGGGKGLVVPVLRSAESLSFAEIERRIADFGQRAQKNSLKMEDLEGGTFTISNGGVFGSMMSTPIVNPPQSGILGLHAIKDRPVALDGQVVIRPIMYLALSYDHRIVDGREAVSCLKGIKDRIENPLTLLLEI